MTVPSRSSISPADPFGLAAARAETLRAWSTNPDLCREAAALEADWAAIGHRGRAAIEMYANAADAADSSGGGSVAVWIDDDSRLHIANTGVPLDADGVRALLGLRVSGKAARGSGDPAGAPAGASAGAPVGRFGVGFAALLTVGDEIEFRSAAGGLTFSAERSRAAAGHAVAPALRLAWPNDAAPAPGFVTEIVIECTDPAAALREFAAEAPGALLDLPGLAEITVGTAAFRPPTLVEGSGPYARWIIGHADGYLHAPTRTDVPVELPVRVVTTLPVTPDRRGLHPDASIAAAATGYADFVAAQPQSQRSDLVPRIGIPAGPLDAQLRGAILRELASNAWIGTPPRTPDRLVAIDRCSVELFTVLTDPEGPAPFEDLLDPLLAPPVASWEPLGITALSLPDLCDRLPRSGAPEFWHRLYAALEGLEIPAGELAEDLATIPVPLWGGAVVTGARGTQLIAGLRAELASDASVEAIAPLGLRIVEPAADHPLLERIGGTRSSLIEVLENLSVGEVDYDDESAAALTRAVIALLPTDSAELESLRSDRVDLGLLALPGSDGDWYPANELLLPGSPLAELVVADSPFVLLDRAELDAAGIVASDEQLGVLGVGNRLVLHTVGYPAGPQDLPFDDAENWWKERGLDLDPPERVVAVRDLDLIDFARTERVLAALAAPELAAAVADRDGYTAWWLRRNATIGDRRWVDVAAPDQERLHGLIAPLEAPEADALAATLARLDVVSEDMGAALLRALESPAVNPTPGTVIAAYTSVAAIAETGWLPESDLPEWIRVADGSLASAARVVVLDRPRMRWVLEPDRYIPIVTDPSPGDRGSAGGEITTESAAGLIAELFEVPLASEQFTVTVLGAGESLRADRLAEVVLAQALGTLPAHADVVRHERLRVMVTERAAKQVDQENEADGVGRTVEVPWWELGGRLHVDAVARF